MPEREAAADGPYLACLASSARSACRRVDCATGNRARSKAAS